MTSATPEEPRKEGGFFANLPGLASRALSAEWQTDAGRINAFGMIVTLAVACISPVLSFFQWWAAAITAWVRGNKLPELFDAAQLMITFLAYTLICVLILAIQSAAEQRRSRED